MTVSPYAADWFLRAEDDLKTIEALLKEGGPANTACFHAQQAAEKYLKGFLAAHERHVRKIHDLEALRAECLDVDSAFEGLREHTIYLQEFYIEGRYPGDYPHYAMDDARKAHAAACSIKDLVMSKLNV